MKNNNFAYIAACIENVALIVLAGFLCWYFKTGWGVLVLVFGTSLKTCSSSNSKQENKQHNKSFGDDV